MVGSAIPSQPNKKSFFKKPTVISAFAQFVVLISCSRKAACQKFEKDKRIMLKTICLSNDFGDNGIVRCNNKLF